MWSLWPWVSAIARTRRPWTRLDDRPVVVGGVDHEHLAIVTDEPDVVGDRPLATVEREHPVGRDELDHRAMLCRGRGGTFSDVCRRARARVILGPLRS